MFSGQCVISDSEYSLQSKGYFKDPINYIIAIAAILERRDYTRVYLDANIARG